LTFFKNNYIYNYIQQIKCIKPNISILNKKIGGFVKSQKLEDRLAEILGQTGSKKTLDARRANTKE